MLVFRPDRGRTAVLIVIALAFALSGCAGFGKKKRPNIAYEERPVELLYSTGATRLDQRRWNEAVRYFDEVERQHPYSEWSRRAILMEAFAYYQSNQYEDAIAAADRFISLYPGNPSAAYAFYIKAICYWEQITDVGRDQAATGQTLAALSEIRKRFPQSQYALDAQVKMEMVQDQLAGKEMAVGRFYLHEGQPLAAIGRFKSVIDRYQTTSHTPEALYRLVEAYISLGLLDEAKRDGAVLGHNFPGNVWYGDAYDLLTSKGLKPLVEPKTRRRGVLGLGIG